MRLDRLDTTTVSEPANAIRAYIVSEILKDEEIELATDSSLIQEGLINSIGVMKLITFLSDHFGLELEDGDYDIDNFETLAAIHDLYRRRSGAAEA